MTDELIVDLSCYVAGPLTWGDPVQNRTRMQLATMQLREEGWDVYNPLEHPRSAACTEESAELGPSDYARGPIYQSLMRDFFQEILRRRQLFVLDGWWQSSGAMSEVYLAKIAGKPVVLFDMDPDKRRPLKPMFTLSVFNTAPLGLDTLGRIGA